MSDFAHHNHHPSLSNACTDRIVVVGPCAAGKTTLVTGLCGLGYDVHACAQEHSEIANLWRHTPPDVLIALKVSIDAVRERRGEHWPEWLYEAQLRRLTDAYQSADLVIDTVAHDANAVLDAAVAYLENRAAA